MLLRMIGEIKVLVTSLDPFLSSFSTSQRWQELHASPHIEHFPILSYPYVSIYGYVLSIYGYVGLHEVLTTKVFSESVA